MEMAHDHLIGMADGPRMLYRTRHIFVLFMGLLSLGLGAYIQPHPEPLRRRSQWSGSILIVIATFLFITAFFYEPTLHYLRSPLSHWGTYAAVAGVLMHTVSGVSPHRR